MAYRVAVDSVGSGVRYDLGQYDDLFVPNNVSIISTDSIIPGDGGAIRAIGGLHSVRVLGLVASGSSAAAITMDNDIRYFTYANIYIGATGMIDGQVNAISIYGSYNYITNHGQISAQSYGIFVRSSERGPAAKIYNYGTITADNGIESFSDGPTSIYNYGKINGESHAISIVGGALSFAYVYNRGQIDGEVKLSEGGDTMLNRGLVNGDVNTGLGDDLLDNRGGTIEGAITMGAGADTFLPGASEETVDGGGDQYDKLDFNKSSGVKIALDGSIDGTGWAAGDTYNGFTDVTGSRLGADTLIGDDGINTLRGLGGNDILSGKGGYDILYGGDGNDTLDGGANGDDLYGGAGNDTLIGGSTNSDGLYGEAGNDILIGGGGADVLVGGTGADTFAYMAKGDFGGTALGTREQINDFSPAERDKIDLSAIDASTKVAGDQAFTFIGGAAFHTVAGELRFEVSGAFITVQGDLNGDGVVDIAFDLNGVSSVVAADFVL